MRLAFLHRLTLAIIAVLVVLTHLAISAALHHQMAELPVLQTFAEQRAYGMRVGNAALGIPTARTDAELADRIGTTRQTMAAWSGTFDKFATLPDGGMPRHFVRTSAAEARENVVQHYVALKRATDDLLAIVEGRRLADLQLGEVQQAASKIADAELAYFGAITGLVEQQLADLEGRARWLIGADLILLCGMLVALYLSWGLVFRPAERLVHLQFEALEKSVGEAERAEAAAQQLAQIKAQFLANMSHEIRT
ncbi:MAG TPA: hypothetical protein VEI97_07660, partial [bacterium]|nr:hypothetical protein [bacterium]